MGILKKIFPSGFWVEVKELCTLAGPMILTQLTQFMFTPIATIFCGHMGKIELDAVAIANSLINVSGLWIILGMSTACDTLFSQTFGSKNRHQLGIVLQTSVIILMLTVLPCWAIFLNAKRLLLSLGQNPTVAKLAGEYLLIFMPGLLFYSVFVPLSKYLQSQNVVLPNLVIGLLSNGICALCHYIFIYLLHMRTNASSVSIAVGYFCMMSFTFFYILASKLYKDTWKGWTKDCLKGLGNFMLLGIFGLITLSIAFCTFEIGVFVAGVLGDTELGAQIIILQTAQLLFMVPAGMGFAAGIRVGQNLGSGNANVAKTAAKVAYIVNGCVYGCLTILVACLRENIARIFTNVQDVIDLTAPVFPIMASYMVFEGATGVGNGILRGMGRQGLAAALNSIIYALGLSAAIPAMLLTNLGIVGYWYALGGTVACEATASFVVIHVITNWQKEVELAEERTKIVREDVELEELTENTAVLGSQKSKENARKTFCSSLTVLLVCSSAFVIGIIVRISLPEYSEGGYFVGLCPPSNGSMVICNVTEAVSSHL